MHQSTRHLKYVYPQYRKLIVTWIIFVVEKMHSGFINHSCDLNSDIQLKEDRGENFPLHHAAISNIVHQDGSTKVVLAWLCFKI
jgi:hypothetical protein